MVHWVFIDEGFGGAPRTAKGACEVTEMRAKAGMRMGVHLIRGVPLGSRGEWLVSQRLEHKQAKG